MTQTQNTKYKSIVGIISRISVVSLSNVVFGVARNKVFALFLGTVGLGVIGQIVNLNNLIAFFVSIGVPLGITRYVSEWTVDERENDIYFLLNRTFKLLLLVSSVISVLLIIFCKYISLFLWGEDKFYILIVFLSLSFPFAVASFVFDAYIRGRKKHNIFTLNAVVTGLVTTLTFILLTVFFNVNGAGLSFFLSAATNLVITLFILYKNKLLDFVRLLKPAMTPNSVFANIIKLGSASLIIGTANQLSLLIIRSNLINSFGIVVNGYYQTILSISTSYYLIFSMLVGVYTLPALSEKKDNFAFNRELDNAFIIVSYLLVPIICSLFVFREILIVLLYSKDFNPATNYFYYFLLGDTFRVLSVVSALWLIPRVKVKSWIAIDVIMNFNMVLLYYLFSKYYEYGPVSFSLAYLLCFFVHFIIHFIYLVVSNKFDLSRKALKIVLSSIFVIIALLFVSNISIVYGYILFLPMIFIWAAFTLRKSDIEGILIIFKKIGGRDD